ncbi:MAG: anti-sigma factor family protein [Gemmatimonadaceae bacterium]
MTDPTMMACEDALRQLATYLDGELDDARRHDLDGHLARCRSCFSRAEFERRLKEQLVTVGKQPVDQRFESRIRALIDKFPSRQEK